MKDPQDILSVAVRGFMISYEITNSPDGVKALCCTAIRLPFGKIVLQITSTLNKISALLSGIPRVNSLAQLGTWARINDRSVFSTNILRSEFPKRRHETRRLQLTAEIQIFVQNERLHNGFSPDAFGY